MVNLMSGGHKAQGAHRNFLLAGHAASRPCLFIEGTEQPDGRAAHCAELLRKIRKRPIGKSAVLHKVILFETRQGRLVSSSNPQRPVSENAFSIGDVAKDFLHGPFSRPISKISFALAASGKQLQHSQALRFENTVKV